LWQLLASEHSRMLRLKFPDHVTSRLHSFSRSKSAGFNGGSGPAVNQTQSWHDRCHIRPHTKHCRDRQEALSSGILG